MRGKLSTCTICSSRAQAETRLLLQRHHDYTALVEPETFCSSTIRYLDSTINTPPLAKKLSILYVSFLKSVHYQLYSVVNWPRPFQDSTVYTCQEFTLVIT